MSKRNVNTFNPRMASVLMAMPRTKASKNATDAMTVKEIAETVGTRPAYTVDWLTGLHDLGLVQQQGKKATPEPEKRWQLTANGRKVVDTLVHAV